MGPTKLASPDTTKFPVTVMSLLTAKVESRVTEFLISAVPLMAKPSLTFIDEESSDVTVVPDILTAPNLMSPVPAALITISEFVSVAFISLSVILILASKVKFAITTEPVPPGVNTVSYTHLTLPTKA